MKAIAEYFRDLAADDRYFGAEPPQPDTEMLHKIAERTIQRRVAAELANNGVILRQETPGEAPAPAAPALSVEVAKADAPAAQIVAPAAAVMASVASVPDTPAPALAPRAEATAPQPVAELAAEPAPQAMPIGGDTVAEKLQRIRAVVAREAEAPAPYSEDQHAEEFGAPTFEGAVLEDDAAPSAVFDTPIEADTGAFEDEFDDALVDETAPADLPEAPEATPKAEQPEDAAPAPAEKQMPEPFKAQTDATEPEADQSAPAAPQDKTAKAPKEDAFEAPSKSEVEAEVEVEEPRAEESAEAAPETPDETPDEAPDAQDIDAALAADEEAALIDAPVVTKPRRRIVVQKISRADMEAAKAAKEAELPPELEAELMAELAEVEADAGAAEAPVQEDIQAAEPAPEDDTDAMLARLNAQTAPAEIADEQVEPADISADSSDDDVLSKMLSGAEADADVEAEAKAEVEVEVAQAEDTAEEDADAKARKSFAAEAEDDAIERLMNTTSSRLDNDESSVRRASIAHLKAAVAATKADSSMAEANDKREEEELGQYRDDLARVVRPQRPTSSGGRGERPAPLVLVSEQRIDRPEEAPDAVAASLDVRPRRVTRGNLALQEEMEEQFGEDVDAASEAEAETQITFPEYAAKAGALELPDLLEAAAAHYTVVESAEHFTRPMLMRKLALITGPEAPSREDGLRAFGTLLRTGKIVKTDNGKFVLSKSSQFA